MSRHLKPVEATKPTKPTSVSDRIPARPVTSSFRIPVYWFEKVRDEAKRLDTSISQVYLRALSHYFGTFDSESWMTTEDAEVYETSKFYTKSQDTKGHSTTMRANVPKPFAGEVASLVASRIVPAYRSTGDVVRDALYHRLKAISRMIDDGDLEQVVDMAVLISEEKRIEEEVEESVTLTSIMRSNAQNMLARGSLSQLRRYLAQRREHSSAIPEPYRDDYLAAIADFETRIDRAESKRPKKNTRRKWN